MRLRPCKFKGRTLGPGSKKKTLWTSKDMVRHRGDCWRGPLLMLVALACLTWGPPRLEALPVCPALAVAPAPSYCTGLPSNLGSTTQSPVTTLDSHSSFPDGRCPRLELQALACAQDPLPTGPLAAALRCLLPEPPGDTLDPHALQLLFRRAGVEALRNALEQTALVVDSNQIPVDTKRLVLHAAWAMASEEPQAGSPGFLSTWFQGPLLPLLPAVDLAVLECLSQLRLTCDGLAMVVQALDSVAGHMEAANQQVVASWIGRFLTLSPCPKDSSTAWLLTNWRGFRHQASFSDLTTAWPGFDAATSLHLLTAPQLAAFAQAKGALDSSELAPRVLQLLNHTDLQFIEAFLKAWPSPPRGHPRARALLEVLLRKLARDLPDLCSPTLRLWFQDHLVGLLPALDPELVLLLPSGLSCQDFQAVYKGLDAVHTMLTPLTQRALFQARRAYLKEQVTKEGSACSFLAASSRLWLLSNFGSSREFANYSDFLQLNPSFKGLEVTDLLTATQLGELLVSEGLLGEPMGARAEAEASTVLDTLQSRGILALRAFLQTVASMATQRGIHSVASPAVRTVILEAVFHQLGPELPAMTADDLDGWFPGVLTLFLASVTPAQLAILPPLANCSQLETIIQDLDSAFDHMSTDTRGNVAQWVTGLLPHLGCNISGPTGFTRTFRRFKSHLNISNLLTTNPSFDGVGLLLELGPVQLAQLTASLPWTLTSEVQVAQLFERLDTLPGTRGLEAFWEELSSLCAQPWMATPSLRRSLLLGTLQRLGPSLPTLPEPEVQHWFKDCLRCVLSTVDAQVLAAVPISLPCGSYRALVSVLSSKYRELDLPQKMDVFAFMEAFLSQKSHSTGPACYMSSDPRGWIMGYLGSFVEYASYAQLTASHGALDVGVVLDLLTPGQFGDALARSDVLAAPQLDPHVASFFLDSPLEAVHEALRAFTATARSLLPQASLQESTLAWLLSTSLRRSTAERVGFTAANWTSLLKDELHFLLPAINQTSLVLLQPWDHEALDAIVAELDEVSGHMPADTRRTVALWVQHQVQTLHAAPAEPMATWIKRTWGSFFAEVTLDEMQALSTEFQPASVWNLLAPRQQAELVLQTAELGNASTVRALLRGLAPAGGLIPLDILDQFLEMFNLVLSQASSPGLLDLDMRRILVMELLPSLCPHLPGLRADRVQHWFQDRLRPLLPALDATSLAVLPRSLSFPVYQALLQAFGAVLPHCPPQTAQDMFNFLQAVLHLQLQDRGAAFSGVYNNSQTFLQQLLGPFLPWASYSELQILYPAFDGFEVLDKLSARHLGALLVTSPALRKPILATRLLAQLTQQSSGAVTDFLSTFYSEAQQRGLSEMPDAQVCTLTLEAVLRLSPDTLYARDSITKFGPALRLLLPGLSARLLPLLPQALDCEAQRGLVETLDSAFDDLSLEQKKLVHGWLLGTLEARRLTQGSTCSTSTPSGLWISLNYGRFRSFGSVAEFSKLKEDFDGVSARALLNPAQLAEVAMLTGALAEEGAGPTQILLETLNCTDQVADFLDALVLAQPPSATAARLLLDLAFRFLGPSIRRLRSADLTLWFQTRLWSFLPAVDTAILAQIPLDISCDAFRNMVRAFSSAFELLPVAGARDVFHFCRDFLSTKASGEVACGGHTLNSRLWLDAHLGNFSVFANYSDLLHWSPRFQGAQVLDRLSPAQLATFSVASGFLTREQEVDQVLAVLRAQPPAFVGQFLDQLSAELPQPPPGVLAPAVQEKMLTQLLPRTLVVPSILDVEGWTQLLAGQLHPLLTGMRPEHVHLLLTHVLDCGSFQTIVAALSPAHPYLPAEARRAISGELVQFLEAQAATTGSACHKGTAGGTPAWLRWNFGSFSADTDFEVFLRLKPDFKSLETLGNLTGAQLAHVSLGPGVLDHLALMTQVLGALRTRANAEIVAFVSEFHLLASQRGISVLSSVPVRDAMLEAILGPVLTHLTVGPGAPHLEAWFRQKLQLWLPGVNAHTLALLPGDLSCRAFQGIMAGLGQSWTLMSLDSRRDVFSFAERFLSTHATPRGAPCSDPEASSLIWLQQNLGPFSSLASYKGLQHLHPNFQAMEALEGLSAPQLAEFLVVDSGLQDSSQATKVLEILRPEDTGPFLDALNAAAHRLSRLPSPDVRRAVLRLLSCHLRPAFHSLAASELATWFGDRLALFLDSLDSKTLGFLPEDLACDSLEALVHVLDVHHINGSFEQPEDLVKFMNLSLRNQVQSTGSVCAPPGTMDRTWLLRYWAFLSPLVSYVDLSALKRDFRGLDSLDLLSELALAQLTTRSGIIYSPSGMTSVLQALESRAVPMSSLAAYLDELSPSLLKSPGLLVNPRVRETIMVAAAGLIFPYLPTLSLDDTTLWLTRLEPFLPSVNATSLALLPLDTPCQHYQAVVKALGTTFPRLSASRRSAVFSRLKEYLATQLADTGSACAGEVSDAGDWLHRNLGPFCGEAVLADLQTLLPILDGVVLAIVGPSEPLTEETLQALGPLAALLTPTQLLSRVDGETLRRALPALANIRGWNPAQATIVVKKMLQAGLQISGATDVLGLGTLAMGIPVAQVHLLDGQDILQLAKTGKFTKILEQAPETLQQAFVLKVLQVSPDSGLSQVPAPLARHIPLHRLLGSQMDTREMSEKMWNPDQARVLFSEALRAAPNFSQLPASILEGFSCGATHALNHSHLAELSRAMAEKEVHLDRSQVGCLARRLARNITASTLEHYPTDILLYLGPSEFLSPGTCETYFRLLGQSQLSVPDMQPFQVKVLLDGADQCLGLADGSLSEEKLRVLGNLSCVLSETQIDSAATHVLTALRSCPSLTAPQAAAIERRLVASLGPPTAWTVHSLQDMGTLAGQLSSATLWLIPEDVKTQFFPDFLAWLKTHDQAGFDRSLQRLSEPPRTHRGAMCPGTPLTSSMVIAQRDLLAARYRIHSTLDTCLPNEVLQSHLALLGRVAFQEAQLQVLKEKLDQVFGAPPEELLPLLGSLARAYSPAEMAQWNITTVDTLSALLRRTSWQGHPERVQVLVGRFLETHAGPLGGEVLTLLSPHICALNNDQLQRLDPTDIREASTLLDSTECPEPARDLLFRQVKAAFQGLQATPQAHYQLLRPVLGGAPAGELVLLAMTQPEMDIDTFVTLNPSEVQKLRAQDLKSLLGENLPELQSMAHSIVVQAWVAAHNPADVAAVGLQPPVGPPDPSSSPTTLPSARPSSGASRTPSILRPALVSLLLLASQLLSP